MLQYPALERKRSGPGLMALPFLVTRETEENRELSDPVMGIPEEAAHGSGFGTQAVIRSFSRSGFSVLPTEKLRCGWYSQRIPQRLDDLPDMKDVRNILLRMSRLTDRKIILSKAHKFSGMKKCWK